MDRRGFLARCISAAACLVPVAIRPKPKILTAAEIRSCFYDDNRAAAGAMFKREFARQHRLLEVSLVRVPTNPDSLILKQGFKKG